MSHIVYGNWIADLVALTCWNCVTKIIVSFENEGNSLTGKIKEMPADLLEKWAFDPQCRRFVHNTLTEAKEAFQRACLENESVYMPRCGV